MYAKIKLSKEIQQIKCMVKLFLTSDTAAFNVKKER